MLRAVRVITMANDLHNGVGAVFYAKRVNLLLDFLPLPFFFINEM